MMVTFDICAGNPGALQFLMQAYDMDMFKAEQGFQRMQRAGITGARLYMLWNDCCNRDTEAALLAMNTLNIESVVEFINYEGGRGIPMPWILSLLSRGRPCTSLETNGGQEINSPQ